MAVNNARPMHDYIREVVTEFLKVYVTSLLYIHQSETKLITFIRRAVAHYVHDSCELL